MVKTANERALERRIMEISVLMEAIVKKQFGLRWWKPKREDNIRLLRLLQWSEKYHVSVSWIVGLLVPIWKEKYAKYQVNGIGVTIATLVGKKSEEILVQSIGEQFPFGEHRLAWRAAKKGRQWRQLLEERRRITWEEPVQAMSAYLRRMGLERKGFQRFSREQRRRNYRGNPWR